LLGKTEPVGKIPTLAEMKKLLNGEPIELAKPEQEPIAHLWECIGRWSAYLATNGKQGNLAPPTWLVDAVKAVTAPSKPWVGLTDDDHKDFANRTKLLPILAKTLAEFIETKLKEKNHGSV
jgi:hypothetical protein